MLQDIQKQRDWRCASGNLAQETRV